MVNIEAVYDEIDTLKTLGAYATDVSILFAMEISAEIGKMLRLIDECCEYM